MIDFLIRQCKKFKVDSYSNMFSQKNEYSEQIALLYGVSSSQINKFALLAVYIYYFIFCIINICFKFNHWIVFISLFFGFFLYFSIRNYFKNKIQNYENDNAPIYQVLSIIINIHYLNLPINCDPNSYLIDLLEQHKYLIINFEQIKERINSGYGLEKCLKEIVFFSPTFTKYIRDLIVFNYCFGFLDYIKDIFGKEYDQFRLYSITLDSRLNILFFFALFYPICAVFMLVKLGFDFEIIILLFLIFLFVMNFLITKMMKNPIILFGAYSPNIPQNEIKKFNTFLKFLQKISYNSVNMPLEYALITSLHDFPQKELQILNLDEYNFNLELNSLKILIENISYKVNSKQISSILQFIHNIYEESTFQGQIFFKNLFQLLNLHNEIGKNQEIIIKSSRGKRKIYKILLSFILGFLSVILYRFIHLFKLYNSIFFDEKSNFVDIPVINYYALICLVFLIFTTISLNKIEKSRCFQLFDLFVLISFIISYYVAFSTLSGII